MRAPKKSILITLVALVAVAAAGYGWWSTDLRYRPKTLKQQAELGAVLGDAGWISPGISETKVLYMVTHRTCPFCMAFKLENFAKLQAAGVDTRVIVYAPTSPATPEAELTTVGEIWKTRNWDIYERWMAVNPTLWKAEGMVPATDPERAALVAKSREFADDMRRLMSENGIGTRERMNLPTLIWRDAKGNLRGCGCEKVETRKYVLKELGVET
jgi:hypothetical protein